MNNDVKITRWQLPFSAMDEGEITPVDYLHRLASAGGGFYPMGANQLWHGGIHIDDGVRQQLNNEMALTCLADGEVIAYRVDSRPSKATYPEGEAQFSTGFTLVHHVLEMPPKTANSETDATEEESQPIKLNLYSLYMHLSPWSAYQNDTTLPAPAYWSQTQNEFVVGEKARDILKVPLTLDPPSPEPQAEIVGLNIRDKPRRGSKIGIVARGSTIRIAEQKIVNNNPWGRIEEVLGGALYPDIPAHPDGGLKGWVFLKELDALPPPPEALNSVVMVDPPRPIKVGELIGYPGPNQLGSDAKVETPPSPLLHFELFTCDDLPGLMAQMATRASQLSEQDKPLRLVTQGTNLYTARRGDTAITQREFLAKSAEGSPDDEWVRVVRQRKLIVERETYLGPYSNKRYRLKDKAKLAQDFDIPLEEIPDQVQFTGDFYGELDRQITRSESSAQAQGYTRRGISFTPANAPEPVWVKGSDLNPTGTQAARSSIDAWNTFPLKKGVNPVDGKVGFPYLMPTQLNGIRRATDETGKVWWFITVGDDAGNDLSGWVLEEAPDITRHSPWEWVLFSKVSETASPAQTLDRMNRKAQLNKADYTPLMTKLYSIINNGDNVERYLTRSQLQGAFNRPWLAQQLSRLIINYESEWYTDGSMTKWDELDDYVGEKGLPYWQAEKNQRIKKLLWWKEIAGKHGISADGKAWHFHPVGMAENFGVYDADIVTYHIYSTGKIVKKSPVKLLSGYERKYKYVYHDESNKEHEICIVEWNLTKKKAKGVIHTSIPSTSGIISDENVVEGDTRRRVKYANGDIAEYGRHSDHGHIWRLYKALREDIHIVKMPDSLDYEKDGVVIKYEFSNTKRRYTGPGPLAGFIGALAEIKEKITTTGSCFKEASCFPSAAHVNGDSVDTLYLHNSSKDQTFISAMKKFHFKQILVGNSSYFTQFRDCSNGGGLHNSHLHSGNFDNSAIDSDNSNPDGRVDVNELSLSNNGRAFIKEWEKFEPTAYNDSKGFCTIGYGHLIARNKCENISLPSEFVGEITRERASELFEERVPDYEKGVKKYVAVKLHQYEFDALVSLLFNIGAEGLPLKTPLLLRKLNSKDYEGTAHEMLDVTNNGTEGLVLRRKSENDLFLNNIYNASH
ncbi:lysozyme [Serratia fonticola]|uniref:lysozyme n=1 Tax=Serratia fonticola TaxID=47917 RepID=UPI0020C66D45|nr:lysozyme [Serratia fonticola]